MPADISIDLGGIFKALNRIGSKIEAEVLRGLDEAAARVANAAKLGHPVLPEALRGSYSPGVVDSFRETNDDGTYRFLTRTGVTRNSILPVSAERKAGRLEAHVVSGQAHSNDLEFGTVDRRAFPFMRPALETSRQWIQGRLELAVRMGLQ